MIKSVFKIVIVSILKVNLIIIFTNSLFAQKGWINYSDGQHGDLVDLHFFNSSTGIVTGGKGIFKTENGGLTWDKKHYGGIFYGGITFFDDSTGIVVGFNETIELTRDGGETWETIHQGSNNSVYLSSACFMNKYVCWAVGQNIYDSHPYDFVLKSVDSGENWEIFEINAGNRFFEITFLDANIGWIVGANGTLYETMNGGANWRKVDLQTNIDLHSIYFIDRSTGWIVGDQGLILKTTDGGKNWNPQSANNTSYFRTVYFVNNQNGWIGGGRLGIIFVTSNGGLTWTKQITNVEYINHINEIFFFNSDTGWAVGTGSVLLKTSTGGFGTVNSLSNSQQLPIVNNLEQNYPNPFNPVTKIKFSISDPAFTRLTVYNMLGEKIKTLVDEFKNVGSYEIKFDATDLASGIYLYTLRSGFFKKSHKMILIR